MATYFESTKISSLIYALVNSRQHRAIGIYRTERNIEHEMALIDLSNKQRLPVDSPLRTFAKQNIIL